jgi:hypothetical protein
VGALINLNRTLAAVFLCGCAVAVTGQFLAKESISVSGFSGNVVKAVVIAALFGSLAEALSPRLFFSRFQTHHGGILSLGAVLIGGVLVGIGGVELLNNAGQGSHLEYIGLIYSGFSVFLGAAFTRFAVAIWRKDDSATPKKSGG